mmetsp:Transcript_69108/g.181070  ORF Transcript_69108/g.181070 Transcript_69108/m.181070 type:complete len:154 (-) Transcript_69108:212-673(-)
MFSFTRSAAAVAIFVCLAGTPATALRARSQSLGADGWWPFGNFAAAAPPKAVQQQVVNKGPKLEDVKDEVLMSAAFGHKTEALCRGAAPEQRGTCRQLAGERLFCALMKRHADKYANMLGAAEEKEKCDSIDIMENSVEAAKDVKEQEEANKA